MYLGRVVFSSLMLLSYNASGDAGSDALARTVLVPAGTNITVALDQTVSTATAKAGDSVSAELVRPIVVKGELVAPKGSRVTGRVVSVARSGRLGGQSSLDVKLSEVVPTDGRPVRVVTSHYARTGKAHTERDIGYIAGGAAVGAILGQVFGKNTQSTLEGTAAGAAAGTGLAAVTGALDFELERGRVLTFLLRQSIRMPVLSEHRPEN